MNEKDIEWMLLVCYARAAGATDSRQAHLWATAATDQGIQSWQTHTEFIDMLAEAASCPQGEAEPPDEGLRQAVMEEWGWDWRTAPACRRVLGEDDFARRRARALQGEGDTDE